MSERKSAYNSIHVRRKIETLFLRKLSFVVTLPVKCNLHFALGIFLRLCSVNIAIPSMNVRYISCAKFFFNFRKLKKLKANFDRETIAKAHGDQCGSLAGKKLMQRIDRNPQIAEAAFKYVEALDNGDDM